MDHGPVPLAQSRIEVDLKLAHRQKGLLWYDTYGVGFRGQYKIRNPDPVERTLGVEFTFPSATAIYDQFTFRVNQQAAGRVSDLSKGLVAHVLLPAGGEALIEVAYDSRGLDKWSYAFASEGVSEVTDFVLKMTTDFADVDFPAGTMSPNDKQQHGGGWRLSWRFASLVTGQQVGMDLPNHVNPGPLAARITAFAPVSLLFFLVVMVILGVLRQPQSASGELRVPVGGVLRVPPAAGLPGGPHRPSRRVCRRLGGEHRAGRVVPPSGQRNELRAGAGGPGAAGLPRSLQLRVLLRGLHRPHRDGRRHRDAVRADAGDGTS